MIKPLTQKDSVEISVESRNSSENNSLIRAPKIRVIVEKLSSNKNFYVLRPPKKSAFIVGDSMIKKIDGYLLTSSINHKYIVKVRPFVTAKTDDMYDHIKPTQRNFQPNVYISHVGTNDLPTDMTPEEISEKIITFSKHLKSEDNEVVVSGIVPRGDSYKEKVEAVNKVLKDTCTKENMHFICHSNINVKRHLNRSNLHLNDNGISALVRNFKNFLNNFESV